MIRQTVLALLLALPLCGQTVRLANHSAFPFTGWKRITCDSMPPHKAGRVGEDLYVLGRAIGADVWVVDVHCTLQPGEQETIELADGVEADFVLGAPLGADWAGGGLTINGAPMRFVSVQPDGAAWLAHMRSRSGTMMCTDVYLRHYPSEPWVHGECMHTCSNPSVPDLFEDSKQVRLAFGDGLTIAAGREFHEPLIDAARYADGQARLVPFTTVFLRHMQNKESWQSAQAVMSMGLGGVGIAKLFPQGNPSSEVGDSGLAWARSYLPGALQAPHSWGPTFAIAANSTQTGAQYDQLYRHGEALMFDGAGAELVTYLAALKWANRPCHHLERTGEPIQPEDHPDCIFWQSRPHWHPSIGRDKLGKPRSIAEWDVPGGWYGADREHWLIGGLVAGARYTGSPALQVLLRHQANAFLLGETIRPGLSTSSSDAARSVYYACEAAIRLADNLEDRTMARAIAERMRQRITQVYVPQMGNRAIWDPRADDRIIGDFDKDRPKRYTSGTMMWQQSVGSYGLDWASERLNVPEGRALALRAAKAVLAHAWRRQQNGQWIFWDNVAYTDGSVLPESEYVEGRGVHRTGWFDHTWALLSLATILRHEPGNAQALEIWGQVSVGGDSWLPPGITIKDGTR